MSNVDNNSEKNSNGVSPEDLNASSQNSADKGQSKSGKKRSLFPFIKSSSGHDEEETPHEEEQEDLIDSRLEDLQDNHVKSQGKNKTKTVLGFETLLTDYDEEVSNPFVVDEDEEGEQPVKKSTKLPPRDTEPFQSDFPLYEMQETTTYFDHDFTEDETAEEELSEKELLEEELSDSEPSEYELTEDELSEDEEIYLKDLFEKTPEESSEPEKKPAFPESVLRFKKSSDEDDEEDFAALRNSLWDREEVEAEEQEEETDQDELEDEFEDEFEFEIGEDEEDQNSPFTVDINSFNRIDEDFVFPQDRKSQKIPASSLETEEETAEENFEDRSFFREEKTQKIPERASDLLESLPETRESLLEGMQEEVQKDLESSAEKEEVLAKKEKGSRKKVLIIVSVLFAVLITFSLAALLLLNRDKPEEISVVITPISAVEGIHPVGLRLPGGWYFLLQTGEIVNGKWEPQVAEWLSGTEVQRIIAIPWTKQLEAYIEALEPGLETQLVMNNNDLLDYKIQKIEEVPRSQVEVLSQTEASLVIIIFQADVDERWVITCQPLATEEQN